MVRLQEMAVRVATQLRRLAPPPQQALPLQRQQPKEAMVAPVGTAVPVAEPVLQAPLAPVV
jgi:hypothetical protein